ncbi:DegT/DnrJ/EryC1/StrS family aminotransferase [Planctomycetota bacterium]|nr:DegT/DnrJ/EryC1/StrS family aminotransferase [Planctomycetota bacterium]
MNEPIYVTKPSLAPLERFTELLQGVWERGILTHNGPLVQRLEKELEAKLGVPRFVAVTNGTIAIQMALRALGLSKGEVITSPFTWVATLSAIKWEGCTPVFVDIDGGTMNMDPSKIEAAITSKTVAIMPVHVFGNPCDVDTIRAIADRHGLKVIYDAAHSMGSTLDGESLLCAGDISATSMHATKLFNTAEGGGCIAADPVLQEKLERIRFFGHDERKEIVEDGFNGKLTEVHAALGLANLEEYDDVLSERRAGYRLYEQSLRGLAEITFQQHDRGEVNYSYFPVVLKDEATLNSLLMEMSDRQIYPRRYFYPSANTLSRIVPYTEMPVSEDLARRILCLPLYRGLSEDTIMKIVEVIRGRCV